MLRLTENEFIQLLMCSQEVIAETTRDDGVLILKDINLENETVLTRSSNNNFIYWLFINITLFEPNGRNIEIDAEEIYLIEQSKFPYEDPLISAVVHADNYRLTFGENSRFYLVNNEGKLLLELRGKL